MLVELAVAAARALRIVAMRAWAHPTIRALVAALCLSVAAYVAGLHRGRATSAAAPCATPVLEAGNTATTAASSTTSTRTTTTSAPTVRTVRTVARQFRDDGRRAAETVTTTRVEIAPQTTIIERAGARVVEQRAQTLQLAAPPDDSARRTAWAVVYAPQLAPSPAALGLFGVERRVGDVLGAELWAAAFVAPGARAGYFGARVQF